MFEMKRDATSATASVSVKFSYRLQESDQPTELSQNVAH